MIKHERKVRFRSRNWIKVVCCESYIHSEEGEGVKIRNPRQREEILISVFLISVNSVKTDWQRLEIMAWKSLNRKHAFSVNFGKHKSSLKVLQSTGIEIYQARAPSHKNKVKGKSSRNLFCASVDNRAFRNKNIEFENDAGDTKDTRITTSCKKPVDKGPRDGVMLIEKKRRYLDKLPLNEEDKMAIIKHHMMKKNLKNHRIRKAIFTKKPSNIQLQPVKSLDMYKDSPLPKDLFLTSQSAIISKIQFCKIRNRRDVLPPSIVSQLNHLDVSNPLPFFFKNN
ncbi:unnamed protein product [Moneuplotes crassus]|uniref:Uncharacterized protein n=1 Tax=Euplotes crassus TaxID=5936 RepID=A0AAD1U1A6_EUPCR|nr:unnamed protein product [Moneuplotes crassus]